VGNNHVRADPQDEGVRVATDGTDSTDRPEGAGETPPTRRLMPTRRARTAAELLLTRITRQRGPYRKPCRFQR